MLPRMLLHRWFEALHAEGDADGVGDEWIYRATPDEDGDPYPIRRKTWDEQKADREALRDRAVRRVVKKRILARLLSGQYGKRPLARMAAIEKGPAMRSLMRVGYCDRCEHVPATTGPHNSCGECGFKDCITWFDVPQVGARVVGSFDDGDQEGEFLGLFFDHAGRSPLAAVRVGGIFLRTIHSSRLRVVAEGGRK